MHGGSNKVELYHFTFRDWTSRLPRTPCGIWHTLLPCFPRPHKTSPGVPLRFPFFCYSSGAWKAASDAPRLRCAPGLAAHSARISAWFRVNVSRYEHQRLWRELQTLQRGVNNMLRSRSYPLPLGLSKWDGCNICVVMLWRGVEFHGLSGQCWFGHVWCCCDAVLRSMAVEGGDLDVSRHFAFATELCCTVMSAWIQCKYRRRVSTPPCCC